MNDKHQSVMQQALAALQEYDKLGYIRDCKPVIRLLLQQLSTNDAYADTIIDAELAEISSMLMVSAIERAKKPM